MVSPTGMSGNTDTRYYWNLLHHIFRYQHLGDEKNTGPHTTNEKIHVDYLLGEIRFFTILVLNGCINILSQVQYHRDPDFGNVFFQFISHISNYMTRQGVRTIIR